MKSVIVACVLGLAALALARPSESEEEKYTDKYDNVDLDEVLGNRNILKNYSNCLLDKGRCTPDAKELKLHIPEALQNDCAKCTKVQKDGTQKVIRHIRKHEPEVWTQLTAKYDPQGEYEKKHADDLKKL